MTGTFASVDNGDLSGDSPSSPATRPNQATTMSIELISIELTNRCDKGCGFCYNRSNPEGGTLWRAGEVVALVRDCVAHGVKAVSFGLRQMRGNVREWCEDVWHGSYHGAPADLRPWIQGGDQRYRVARGGSWYDGPGGLRSAHRHRDTPDIRNIGVGFRLVCEP